MHKDLKSEKKSVFLSEYGISGVTKLIWFVPTYSPYCSRPITKEHLLTFDFVVLLIDKSW